MLADVSVVNGITFAIAAMICLVGSIGVVALRNPVHNALSLVGTLFGVAVLFISQEAYFLAAIQVIVYAGAIVILFLFVLMLLGVDKVEALVKERDPVALATGAAIGGGIAGGILLAVLAGTRTLTGTESSLEALEDDNVAQLGRILFSDYAFAFELTSGLLAIAVVGAVVLSRRAPSEPIDLDEFPEPEPELEDTDDDADGTSEVDA